MMRILYKYVLAVAALSFGGCHVHQWPEMNKQPNYITLQLHYEPDFWVWEHLYDPKQDEYPVEMYPDSDFDTLHPGTTSVYDNTVLSSLMDVRVKFYSSGNMSNCVAEYNFTRDAAEGYDCEVNIELPGGSYEVVVWSQLLSDSGSVPFYEASDLRGVSIIDGNYRGSTDYRDGFRGRVDFELPEEPEFPEERICEVEMRRPMGKFEFVTTDLAEFLDRETVRRNLQTRAKIEDYDVVISYPYYYPNGYNAVYDDIASNSGYRFTTRMTITGEEEASMGFDYVFINDIPDGHVQAQIAVFDTAGEPVSNSQTIMIPIRRDYHTVLRGAFLSMNANGGVGIDPGFDGDHNIFP
ncbi:MAG: hypothetical protein J1E04_04445 [Alistipes sp.]|nr:hypothetical protein [Alistipes sp.]